jgi:pimeloyl-ACP methyl ester carboxylesterase
MGILSRDERERRQRPENHGFLTRTCTGRRTWESGWQAAEDSAGDDSLSIKLLPFGYGTDLMKVLFLHGWHSVPGGVKPTYLAEHGLEVLNPALDDDDFGAAVATAQAQFDKHQPQVVVGSSRGGAVAMNIKSGDAGLVLLCPAWRNWGTVRSVKADTVILHSRADDVIPFADSEELVRNSGLPTWTLVEVGNDHRLADPESLATMLDACPIRDGELR